MKIALCTEILYPLYGVERRVYEMAKRFEKFGIDTDLYTSTEPERFPSLKIKQVSHPTIINPPKRNYTSCIKYWYSLSKALLKNKYDIIDLNGHLPLIPGSLVGKIKNMPTVATIHDLYLNKWSGLYKFAGLFVGLPTEVLMTKMPYTKIITINSSVKERLIKTFKINSERISLIPSGIDVNSIDKVKENKKGDNIIYVSRLVPQKNLNLLLHALTKVPKIKLKIVGEGKEYRKLVLLCKKLNIEKRVEFLGKLDSHNDVIGQIKKSKMLILPSIRENFGIVPLEAMACGTPVISTNTEGPRDYIKNGENGFLTKMNDVNDLANKIALLADDDQLVKKISINGRRTAEKYDWDIIVKKIVCLYNEIL